VKKRATAIRKDLALVCWTDRAQQEVGSHAHERLHDTAAAAKNAKFDSSPKKKKKTLALGGAQQTLQAALLLFASCRHAKQCPSLRQDEPARKRAERRELGQRGEAAYCGGA